MIPGLERSRLITPIEVHTLACSALRSPNRVHRLLPTGPCADDTATTWSSFTDISATATFSPIDINHVVVPNQ